MKSFASAVMAAALAFGVLPAQTRQANLGRCQLELGGVIQDCRVGHRTFGALDAGRRNAILIPTWFASGADAWLPLPTGANAPSRTSYAEDLATQARQLRDVNLSEWAWHSRAILRHDISRSFGGDMTQAARAWKGTTLIVSATHDHSVDAAPALQFARLIGADTLVIPTAAGHSAIFGDSAAKAAVRQFLRK